MSDEKVMITKSKLTDIGDALRDRTNTTDTYKLADMPQAIRDIPSGGGGGGDKYEFLVTGFDAPASIENNTNYLRPHAFSYCYIKDNMTWRFPEVVHLWGNETKSTYTHNYTFAYCKTEGTPASSSVRLVDLPKLDTNGDYGQYIFYNSEFTHVNIPSTTYIPSYAFTNGKRLKKVYANKVKYLGSYAFSGAGDDTGFDLICNATRINASMCLSNAKINSLVILGEGTGTTLCTLYYGYIGGSWLITQSDKGFVYVRDDLVDAYKSASGWVNIASKIKPLSEYSGNLTL